MRGINRRRFLEAGASAGALLAISELGDLVPGGGVRIAYAAGDDYPYKSDSSQSVDPWKFYKRNCTSFVAFRLNKESYVLFTNDWSRNGRTVHFGDAANWKSAATSLGYTVNNVPTPGSVAWFSYGHVAWVRSVSGTSVFIEEYNHPINPYAYNERWLPASAAQYIHFDRLGVLTYGLAAVKEGGLSTDWGLRYAGVKALALSGERVGIIDSSDTAWVKEGPLSADWTRQCASAKQLVLAGNRIGAVTTYGTAWVKEGDLGAGWVNVGENVQQLALSGNRIGIISTFNGTVYVKEGGLGAGWVQQFTGAKHLALSGNRLGIVLTSGAVLVKEGGLGASWVTECGGAQVVSLCGNRIGVLLSDGLASVKDGGLSAAWTQQSYGVSQLVLGSDRIGVLTYTGASVKEGGLGASWIGECGGVQQLALTQ